MSYLDDADHDWSLEPPPPQGYDGTLTGMVVEDMPTAGEEGIRIILRGYAGLKQRHPEASDEACLGTSLVWWFG